jgi:tetratricopeptide (TPR) repeat protein
MILTQCAVCATELGLSLGKKCGRCSTRYCGAACQVQHWKEGGHDQLCKKIKRAGGAEQYNANEKYAEAVAVAAEKCAEDTKGQTCYICTEGAKRRHAPDEGLVRMCACRGTSGFAHISCLAEQAKILVDEAEENNLIGTDRFDEKWERWHTCSLCEQKYHGVVRCSLGWACWKTYVGRAEADKIRGLAMNLLGNGLFEANRHEDALPVREAELAMKRRIGNPGSILATQNNLASTYHMLGRHDEANRMLRDIYSGCVKLFGEEHRRTLIAASNYATSLIQLKRFEEPKSLLRKVMPVARRVLGESHDLTLRMRWTYAQSFYKDPGATLDDLREAVATLEEVDQIARRVLGGAHPLAVDILQFLRESREALSACEITEAYAAMMTPSPRA